MSQYKPFFNWAANKFHVDPGVLWWMAQEESGFDPQSVNDWDSNAAKGTPSKGMMQFIEPTFNSFYATASKARPKVFKRLGPKNWMDWRQQVALAAWAVKNGAGPHWATYNEALKHAGPIGGGMAFGQAMPGGGGGGFAKPGTQGYSGKVEFNNGYWKPGKPLDTGKLNQIQFAFDRSPWWIDKLQKPVYKAAQPTYVQGKPVNYKWQVQGQPGGGGGSSPWKGGVGSIKALPRKPGEPAWKYLQRLGQKLFGLKNDPGNYQTTGGQHVANSDHYKGTAIDFGNGLNSEAQLNAWHAWLQQNAQQLGLDELIWQAPGHYDHVHASLVKGKQPLAASGNPFLPVGRGR